MKSYSLFAAFFAMCLVKSFSQEDTHLFGKFTAYEIEMKQYEKDTAATAIILYERGDATVKRNEYNEMRVVYTYQARVKIFKKTGFSKADYRIPLIKSISSKDKEKLQYAKAVAVNANKSPIFLNPHNIYMEDYDEYREYAKFTVPNVTEGTVFDVEYQTESPFLFNFQEWKFQDDIPKIYSEYNTSVPANYKYNSKLVGYLTLTNHVPGVQKNCFSSAYGMADCELNTYTMKDIPAFIEEPYINSKDNHLSKITFELREYQSFTRGKEIYTKSWESVDKELKMSYSLGSQSKKEDLFKKWLPAEISAMPITLDKAKVIYHYLQSYMTWNGKYQLFKDADVKTAFEKQTGNVAELNLILLNMLRAGGFEASFMILSTRENGAIFTELFPVLSEFNYLAVKVEIDGKSYPLDITDKYLPFGMLPFRALNGYGRVIDFKKESYWYDLTNPKISLNTNYVQYQVDASGAISANMMNTYTGYFATQKRGEITNASKENYIQTLENRLSAKGTEATVAEYKTINQEDLEAPLKETFKLKIEPPGINNKIIHLYPFLGNIYGENPFKLENRTYPVDFGYLFGYNHQISVKVDPAYEITSVPEEKTLTLEDQGASINLKSYTNNNELSIALTFFINKPVFISEEYSQLKKLFTELVAIHNNLPVILKKK